MSTIKLLIVLIIVTVLLVLVSQFYSVDFGQNVDDDIDLPPQPPQTSGAINCLSDQRNVDACIEIYQPVCGVVHVQCITEPCDPVEETFPNSCFACQNPLVSSYTEGECPVLN